ncbi:MAG: hypothetical protein ABR981_05735 [Candidatus Micrarchaeaceae archaeon]|jgi:hypothetical protein
MVTKTKKASGTEVIQKSYVRPVTCAHQHTYMLDYTKTKNEIVCELYGVYAKEGYAGYLDYGGERFKVTIGFDERTSRVKVINLQKFDEGKQCVLDEPFSTEGTLIDLRANSNPILLFSKVVDVYFSLVAGKVNNKDEKREIEERDFADYGKDTLPIMQLKAVVDSMHDAMLVPKAIRLRGSSK